MAQVGRKNVNQLIWIAVCYLSLLLPLAAVELGQVTQELKFTDDFETMPLQWSAVVGEPAITLTSNAAAAGNSGLSIALDSSSPAYLIDTTVFSENHYNAAFYVDLASATFSAGESPVVFSGLDLVAGSVVRLELVNNGADVQIVTVVTDNHGVEHSATAGTLLQRGIHQLIRLEWWTAASPTRKNGGASLWIDGENVLNLTSLDNDRYSLGEAHLGWVETVAGSQGSIYFDEFVFWLGSASHWLVQVEPFDLADLPDWKVTGNSLTVPSSAALAGSGGLAVDLGSSGSATNESPLDETHYHLSFYLDPHTASIDSADEVSLVQLVGETGQLCAEILLSNVGGSLALSLRATEDDLQTTTTSSSALTSNWQPVRLEWWAADHRRDGGARLWSDGSLVSQIIDLNNEDQRADQLVFSSGDGAAANGSLQVDQLRAWRHRATIREDPFEVSGLWNAEQVSAGNQLTLSANAALEGTLGLEIEAVATAPKALLVDLHPTRENHYHASFLLSLADFSLEVGASVELLTAVDSTLGDALGVVLSHTIDGYALVLDAWNDSGLRRRSESVSLPVSTAPVRVHVEWLADDSAPLAEGRARLWIDGFLGAELLFNGNDSLRLDTAYFGMGLNLFPNTSGHLYLDDFESWNGSFSQAVLLHDNFESRDLSAWDGSHVTPGGNLEVLGGTELEGAVDLWSEISASGELAYASADLETVEQRLNSVFRLAVVDNPAQAQTVTLLEALSDDETRTEFAVELGYVVGLNRLRVVGFDVDGSRRESDWLELPSSDLQVEIEWFSSDYDDLEAGGVTLTIGGQAKGVSLDNFGTSVGSVRLGITNSSALAGPTVVRIDAFTSSLPIYPSSVNECRDLDDGGQRGDCDDFDGG